MLDTFCSHKKLANINEIVTILIIVDLVFGYECYTVCIIKKASL